jgi:hypothetical protein
MYPTTHDDAGSPGPWAPLAAFRQSPICSTSIIFIVSCILMLPIWWFGLPINAHDAKVHASWQYYFSAQLWSGDLYPRWLPGMNEGMGSPSFFVYPPLSQYAASLLAPFSDSVAWVYQRIGIAATAAFILSGIGTNLWLRKVTQDRTSALVGAIVLLAAPYHLFIDTYYRAAYAELWAFAWAPFSLLAIHLFRERVKMALLVYTAASAALLLSHAPSCIALLPAYVAYAALLSIMYKRKGIFVWTCVATGIAILIAGSYLGSALTHQENINKAALFTGSFDFSRWFMFSATSWANTNMQMGLTGTALLQFSIVMLLGFVVIKREVLDRRRQLLAGFTVATSLIILFMMSGVSAPVWRALPVLQKVQFPWRLLVVQTFCLAMIASLFASSLRYDATTARTASLRLVMPVIMLGLIAVNFAMGIYTKPSFTASAPLRVRDAPEYQLGSIDKASRLFQDAEKFRLLVGNGHISVETISSREIRIHVKATTSVNLILRHFYYQGWGCSVPPGQASCSVGKYDNNVPVIRINAAAGDQVLTLRLSPSLYDQLGFYATLVGLAILASLLVFIPRFGRGVPVSATRPQAIDSSFAEESQIA